MLTILSIEKIASVGTIIQTIFVIVTIFYVKKQLDEVSLSRRLTLLKEIITEIGNDKIRDLRIKLLNNESKSLSKDDYSKLGVSYDRISFMLLNDKKTALLFYDFQGKEILQIWEQIQLIIKDIRTERNNPEYCIHFEKLYLFYTSRKV